MISVPAPQKPQCGHVMALLEILDPHSGQNTIAIASPFIVMDCAPASDEQQ
jgi:hypothetical protein